MYNERDGVNLGHLVSALNRVRKETSGKQDAPKISGSVGQVLMLDDELNPVWGDGIVNGEEIDF